MEKKSVETGSKPPPVQPRLRFAPRGQALHRTDRLLRISSQALLGSRLGSAPTFSEYHGSRALGTRSRLPRPVHERAAAADSPPPSPGFASAVACNRLQQRPPSPNLLPARIVSPPSSPPLVLKCLLCPVYICRCCCSCWLA